MSTATQPISGTFAADPVHSSFQFAVKHMKVATFRAGFDDVDARLVAGDDGVTLEGRAKVESVSVTNPPELREHLVNSTDFFDAGANPEIVFASRDVVLAEDGTATVEGELTIKGITRPVVATGTYTAPSTDAFGNTRGHLTLVTTINRREFDFNWDAPLPNGGSALADDVVLNLDISFVAQA